MIMSSWLLMILAVQVMYAILPPLRSQMLRLFCSVFI